MCPVVFSISFGRSQRAKDKADDEHLRKGTTTSISLSGFAPITIHAQPPTSRAVSMARHPAGPPESCSSAAVRTREGTCKHRAAGSE